MHRAAYDVIVIGGGPGGSTVSTLLARAGRRVLLLEKEKFPRFHIGESLLPYNSIIFDELGVADKLANAGFTRKLGAQFHIGNGSKGLKLVFKNGAFTRKTSAYQVDRSRFDQILLNHAAENGVEVREGWTVTSSSHNDDGGSVQARSAAGQVEQFSADWLVDATGRGNFTGNQENLRVVNPKLKKVAVFGHFENVRVDDGTAGGDTLIIRMADKWFWIIPMGARISVGCVLDQKELAELKQTPAEVFYRFCAASTEMRSRMANAHLLNEIQATSDFSYRNKRLIGPRLLRVGDAAGFMDPIFSAGVYLAMYSGSLAAKLIIEAGAKPARGPHLLRAYERRVFRAMDYYAIMVEKFYTTPFMELFMEPRPKFNLPDAIVAILAGELEGGMALEVRRRLFFLLIRLQAIFPLVPRLSFEEPAPNTEPDVALGEPKPSPASSGF